MFAEKVEYKRKGNDMAICIVCGKESDSCLCEACKEKTDIKQLSIDIINYKPESGDNPLWDNIAREMNYSSNFKNIVFAITSDIKSPEKEYLRIICMARNGANIPKASRPWLYEIYTSLFSENSNNPNALSEEEKNRVDGILLGALFMDYRYTEADEIAGRLLEKNQLPWQVYYNLVDFFSKTRRYDEASESIEIAEKIYGSKSYIISNFSKLKEQNDKYRNAETDGKKEYMPNPKENRDEVKQIYIDFLASIGIEIEMSVSDKSGSKSRYPVPIPKDQYPEPKEIREADFDSFVAFDLETTGFSTSIDSIIEIGAIKVIDGHIVETEEFTFHELVKPFKRAVKQEVTDVTGITKEDVKNAREMWEVTPDFLRFVGDSILLGFNSMKFDSKFLVRAGRYSQIIIENPHFDVKRYAAGLSGELGINAKDISLSLLAEKLGIENPKAHRALSDAITTARVYMKLKEKYGDNVDNSLDDILSDIDEW
jgi:DNA polymerase-3 subunit alpha (Gram-positive type)